MPREGRPPRLTPERQARLVNSITAGNTIRAAAETSDLGFTTVKRYLARGRAAQAAVDSYLAGLSDARRAVLDRWDDRRLHAHLEQQVAPSERIYWNLAAGVTRGHALAEEGRVARLAEAGTGWRQVEEHVTTQETLDKAGNVITLTTRRTVTRIIRDWRADLAWLQARNREDWGRQARVDVGGIPDAPLIVETAEQKRARGLAVLDEVNARRVAKLELDERQAEFEAGNGG
jgi:hypothetical protein